MFEVSFISLQARPQPLHQPSSTSSTSPPAFKHVLNLSISLQARPQPLISLQARPQNSFKTQHSIVDWTQISHVIIGHDDKIMMQKSGYKLINYFNYCLQICQHENYITVTLLLC